MVKSEPLKGEGSGFLTTESVKLRRSLVEGAWGVVFFDHREEGENRGLVGGIYFPEMTAFALRSPTVKWPSGLPVSGEMICQIAPGRVF